MDDQTIEELIYKEYDFSGIWSLVPIVPGQHDFTPEDMNQAAKQVLKSKDVVTPFNWLWLQSYAEAVQQKSNAAAAQQPNANTDYDGMQTTEIAIPAGHMVWRCPSMEKGHYTTLEGALQFSCRSKVTSIEQYVLKKCGNNYFVRVVFVNYKMTPADMPAASYLDKVVFKGWPVDSNEVRNIKASRFLAPNPAGKTCIGMAKYPENTQAPVAFWDKNLNAITLRVPANQVEKKSCVSRDKAQQLVSYSALGSPERFKRLSAHLSSHTKIIDKKLLATLKRFLPRGTPLEQFLTNKTAYIMNMTSAFMAVQLAAGEHKRNIAILATESHNKALSNFGIYKKEKADKNNHIILWSYFACTKKLVDLISRSAYIQWLTECPEIGRFLLTNPQYDPDEPIYVEEPLSMYNELEKFEASLEEKRESPHLTSFDDRVLDRYPAICFYKLGKTDAGYQLQERSPEQMNYLVKGYRSALELSACTNVCVDSSCLRSNN